MTRAAARYSDIVRVFRTVSFSHHHFPFSLVLMSQPPKKTAALQSLEARRLKREAEEKEDQATAARLEAEEAAEEARRQEREEQWAREERERRERQMTMRPPPAAPAAIGGRAGRSGSGASAGQRGSSVGSQGAMQMRPSRSAGSDPSRMRLNEDVEMGAVGEPGPSGGLKREREDAGAARHKRKRTGDRRKDPIRPGFSCIRCVKQRIPCVPQTGSGVSCDACQKTKAKCVDADEESGTGSVGPVTDGGDFEDVEDRLWGRWLDANARSNDRIADAISRVGHELGVVGASLAKSSSTAANAAMLTALVHLRTAAEDHREAGPDFYDFIRRDFLEQTGVDIGRDRQTYEQDGVGHPARATAESDEDDEDGTAPEPEVEDLATAAGGQGGSGAAGSSGEPAPSA